MSPLSRCPVDGVPLLLIAGGGLAMIGCELCDRALFYDGPREPWDDPEPLGASVRRRCRERATCWTEAVRAYATVDSIPA